MSFAEINSRAEVSAPNVANAVLVAVVMAISAAQYGVLPLALGHGVVAATALVMLVGLTTPLHWGLVHESFHGVLSRHKSLNRLTGRALAILLWMSWDSLRFGHLTHHDANRHQLDRPEVLPQGWSWHRGAGAYYTKLLGGHAFLSAISTLLAWLPIKTATRMIDRIGSGDELKKFRANALKCFSNPERRNRIRLDSLIGMLLIVGAFWCWGTFWPAFALSYLVRYAILSTLDNAHHYGTVLDSGTDARNTWLPGWTRFLVLNQNFHGIHHARPELRWSELPHAFRRSGKTYNGTWHGCVLRQFHGPVRSDDLTSVSGRP